MFGVIAATMALGTITVSASSVPMALGGISDTKPGEQVGMLGHLTLTATTPEGKITSYIQTDNIIVNRGENCTVESLFNVETSGADECLGSGVAADGFTFIAIGDGGDIEMEMADDKKLQNELARLQDTDPEHEDAEGAGAEGAVVTLRAVFTADMAETIDESGIFDADTDDGNDPLLPDGNMLARKTFDEISLNSGDKLTVEWEITIGS